MRILHIIPSIAPGDGGPSQVIVDLMKYQIADGIDAHVLTEEFPANMEQNDAFIEHHCPRCADRFHRCAKGMNILGHSLARRANHWLKEHAGEFDLFHIHGLWSGIALRAWREARRHNIPYIVRPAGMLEPWSLRQKSLLKKVAMCAAFRKYLRQAAALHATAESEAEQFRRLGFTNPIAVIPNGVDVELYQHPVVSTEVDDRWPTLKGHRRALFLSRVHPKKGLDMLLNVWQQLRDQYPDWRLVIAGPGDEGYVKTVRELADKLQITDSVVFTGPVYDQLKVQLFATSDLFVLPTHSENFGVVIAESLAAGVPVITTVGTPWRELQTHQCGWWIDISQPALLEAMRQAMSLDAAQRSTMGQAGQTLIQSKYTWPAVASDISRLYGWLQKNDTLPVCVNMNSVDEIIEI